jgi:hypothetical protein
MRRWQAAIAATAILVAPATAAEQPSRPFNIRAVLDDSALSRGQLAAMKSEVDAIWAPLEVRISWRRGLNSGELPADWTVAVDIRESLPLADPSAPQPLGAVAVVQGQMRRTIFVSRRKVQQLVAGAGVRTGDGFHDHVFGRFVGRIVAHELGHLLLDSSRHRDIGLMRQRFEVQDVLTSSRSRYTFGEQDLIALRERLLVRTGDTVVPLSSSGFAVASTPRP